MGNKNNSWIEVDLPSHKLKDSIWVECIAEIKCVETNEVRECKTNEILKMGDEFPSVFNWEENNYSCDCNRHIFFNIENENMSEDDLDIPCSHGKYLVNLKNKKDGKYYYREF